jgi:membrane protein YqaA with SNARE-associated domain
LETLIDLGYPGLFIASFLAATIVPFSSEAVLAAMLLGPFHPFWCLFWASLGNWGGGMSSFALGWLGRTRTIEKWLRLTPEKISKFNPYVKRWGIWLALFCWLPLVGDIFAVALGFARTPAVASALFMLIGKAARYVAVYYLVYAIA